METIELKSKAFKGSLWAIIEKFLLQIMQFIVAVVLARLLSPKDFGLIVLATLFTGISAAIADGGFEKTIIHQKELSPVQIDTIFYINVCLGALLTVLLFVLAPFIAAFFHEPNLTSVLRFISIGTFINALSQIQRTLLMKELNFKKLSIVQIISSLAGGVTGVILAISGFGVWALVFSMLTAQVLLLIMFWVKSSWYPSFNFSYSSIKILLPYGLNILFSSIVFFFIQQFSNFIIGKYYAGRELGLVNRGSKTPEIVTGIIQSIIVKIAFPVLSKIQNDSDAFHNGMKKLVQTIAFILFPLLFLLFANAADVTLILFTKKWMESIIFVQIFCLVKIFDPFVSLFREVILAKGMANMLSRALTITSIVEVTLILACVSFGISYVIFALMVSMIFQYFYYCYILSKKINVSLREQFSWIMPYLVLATLTAASSFLLTYLLKDTALPLLIKLIIKCFFGGAIYVAGLFILKINEASYFRLKNNSLLNLKTKM